MKLLLHPQFGSSVSGTSRTFCSPVFWLVLCYLLSNSVAIQQVNGAQVVAAASDPLPLREELSRESIYRELIPEFPPPGGLCQRGDAFPNSTVETAPAFCNCFRSSEDVSYREGGQWIPIDNRATNMTAAQGFTELMQNQLDRVMAQTGLSPSQKGITQLQIKAQKYQPGMNAIEIHYAKSLLASVTLHCDKMSPTQNLVDENARCHLFLTNYQTSFVNQLLRNGQGGKEKKGVNSNQAGQFGEGMKVGIFKLLLDKFEVMYFQNRTIWQFSLHQTKPHYKGDAVDPDIQPSLHFRELRVAASNSSCDSLTVQVSGSGKAIGGLIKALHDRFLHFKPINGLSLLLGEELPPTYSPAPPESEPILHASNVTFLSGYNGDVLMESRERGRVYVNGLLVHTESNLMFGYNVVDREVAKALALTADRNRLNLHCYDGYRFVFHIWEAAAYIKDIPKMKFLVEKLDDIAWQSTFEALSMARVGSVSLVRYIRAVLFNSITDGSVQGQFWNTTKWHRPNVQDYPPSNHSFPSVANQTLIVLMPHGWKWNSLNSHTEALYQLWSIVRRDAINLFTVNVSKALLFHHENSSVGKSDLLASVHLGRFRTLHADRQASAEKIQENEQFWNHVDSSARIDMPQGQKLPPCITYAVVDLISSSESALKRWSHLTAVVVNTTNNARGNWIAELRDDIVYINHNLNQRNEYQSYGAFAHDVALISRLVFLVTGRSSSESSVMRAILAAQHANSKLPTFHSVAAATTGGDLHSHQTPTGAVPNIASAFESKPFIPSHTAENELDSMTPPSPFARTYDSDASHSLGGGANVNLLDYSSEPFFDSRGVRLTGGNSKSRVLDADNDHEWVETAKMIPVAIQPTNSYRVYVPAGSLFENQLPASTAALAANFTSLLAREIMPRVRRYLPFPAVQNLNHNSLAWHPYLFYANHSVAGRCHPSQRIGYNLAQFEAMLNLPSASLVEVYSQTLSVVIHEVSHAAVRGRDYGIDGGHGINFSRMLDFAIRNMAAEIVRGNVSCPVCVCESTSHCK